MGRIDAINTDLAIMAATRRPLPQAQSQPAGAAAPKDLDAAMKAAKDFESVLLHKLMEEMQKTVPQSGILDSPMLEQTQGLFWFNLAQELAASGGIGLWKDVYRQMTGAAPPSTMEHVR